METPALGILAGALFTALVQSSSATTGVVIVMASQGFISLPAGIALSFGANIGTCVTALLAAIGKPREALRAGTVHVDPYRAIERYSHVMHIVSGVQGELDEQYDQFDLFAASFPAGTLVGAPKVRAMEIIEEMESVGRGLYAGTAGYFGASGDMDQAITIRTLVFSGDEYSFQAGAGIVADSVPEREYQEVLAKSAILRRALEMAGEGW